MRKDNDFERFKEKRSALAARDNAIPSTARQTTLDKLAEQAAKPAPAPEPERAPHVPQRGSVSDQTYHRAREAYDDWIEKKERERSAAAQEEQNALLRRIADQSNSALNLAVRDALAREVPPTVDSVRESLVARADETFAKVRGFDRTKQSQTDLKQFLADYKDAQSALDMYDSPEVSNDVQ